VPSLVRIEFAVLYSSVSAKRYMSWAMEVGKNVGVFHAKDLYVAWTSERIPTTPKGDKLRTSELHELIEAPDHMMGRTVIRTFPILL